MNVIVTGGGGFVGSHIVDELIRKGYKVIVYDNASNSRPGNINPKAKIVLGDLNNFTLLKQYCSDADFVFHQAALSRVGSSFDECTEYVETNVQGTINLLKVIKKSPVQKIIYASSASVYGNTKRLPTKEEYSKYPINPYGVTKLAAEQLIMCLCKKWKKDAVALRYANVFGPRQLYNEKGPVVAAFMNFIKQGISPNITGNGKQTRSFTYVDDVVQANMIALENEMKSEIFNVAGAERTSVNDLFEMVRKLWKKKIKPTYIELPGGEVAHSHLDITKLLECGYEPTPLKTSLKEYKAWFDGQT